MRYLKTWERALPGGKGTPGEGGSVKLCLSLFHQCGHAESDPPRGRWTEGVTRQNRFYGGRVSQAKQMRPTLKEKPTLSTTKHWQKGSCEKAGAQGSLHQKHEACGFKKRRGGMGLARSCSPHFCDSKLLSAIARLPGEGSRTLTSFPATGTHSSIWRIVPIFHTGSLTSLFCGFLLLCKTCFHLNLDVTVSTVRKSSTFILGKIAPKSEFPLLSEAERRSELYLARRKACSSSHPKILPRVPFLFSEPVSCRSGP